MLIPVCLLAIGLLSFQWFMQARAAHQGTRESRRRAWRRRLHQATENVIDDEQEDDEQNLRSKKSV
ncbi:MAG: hypothetical protein KDA85_01900, partial [Planctomycetaceae bacterium]|nr:hypothetical protein [Planctomycetaceae bacterium]